MLFLVDSGILLRLVNRSDAEHAKVRAALRLLKQRGDSLVTAAQNMSEFWNVCTRPASARGGYGLSLPRLGTGSASSNDSSKSFRIRLLPIQFGSSWS